MVHYRRNFIPGGTYFFTVTLADRRSTLLTDHIAPLRAAIRTAKAEQRFEIDAIVILPEHLHAVMTLAPGDADFPRLWRRLKGHFTQTLLAEGIAIPQTANGEHQLWQRRFWEHTIRDDTDFARHVDYVHFNPVKHRLVPRVADWPHSSFHRFVQAGTLPEDWGGTDANDSPGYGERET
jgi:putative transposase